jgi:hydrogenase maturation protein HypF
VRVLVRVSGVVQGVGFRPYVHALAARFDLAGWVGNDANGVFVEVEGAPDAVAAFTDELPRGAPPLAAVDGVTVEELPVRGDTGFVILESRVGGEKHALVPADSATCDDCLRELLDPADRRFGYAFVNCTNCGPRYTIVRDVPYDRPATTMAGFAMCADCASEYHDPHDRRFHAQPVCCPACGPRLRLADRSGSPVAGDPVAVAADLLREGLVVAVKGLGGYHLAADATCATGVEALRQRKHREEKPFAVMVPDLASAEALCRLDDVERRLLTSVRRPVVLLPRRAEASLAGAVAPGNRYLGLMLPYTPLHHLLCRALAGPFVLTSGNVSDEPIAYLDGDAYERLGGIADYYLTHDRPIHTRTDDSVVRVFEGRELPVRRSRGYVPEPTSVPVPARRPVLACGAELKHTFCLLKQARAVVSQHVGDLENYETYRAFIEGVAHLSRLVDVRPEVVAYDLHPEYLSTKYALALDGVEHVGVQHHHAHVASCLADNGVAGPAIGVAFDGLGYGTDGTLWGGELLVADLVGFERVGHLVPVPLPGGSTAIRQPWRMAAAYLDAAYGDGGPGWLDLRRRHEHWDTVVAMARGGVNAPLTSSAGRLFDAVAALLGVRDVVTYEGQAAVELEQLADPAERSAYPVTVGPNLVVEGTQLVRAVVDDVRRGADPARVAARFHNGLSSAVVAVCERVREVRGLETVALSGGVFQNVLLLGRLVADLRATGFTVLTHHRVPPNDGGISLGQAAVAAARDAERR